MHRVGNTDSTVSVSEWVAFFSNDLPARVWLGPFSNLQGINPSLQLCLSQRHPNINSLGTDPRVSGSLEVSDVGNFSPESILRVLFSTAGKTPVSLRVWTNGVSIHQDTPLCSNNTHPEAHVSLAGSHKCTTENKKPEMYNFTDKIPKQRKKNLCFND